MTRPVTTRLRYVSAKKPADLVKFLGTLGSRVQVYGAPVYDGKRWFLWFVPPDDIARDIPSRDL